MEVVENKNAPGNGLTDTVSPEEGDPLNGKGNDKKQPKKGFLSSLKKEKMSEMDADVDPEDPGPSVSDSENDQELESKKRRRRQGRKDVLGIWAHKLRLTPKRGLIYLLFCGAVILLLLLVLFLIAALWPRGPSHEQCESAQCHSYSAQVLGALNSSVKPCDDYFEYSCGGWLQAHPLPRYKAFWDTQAHQEFIVKDKLRTLLNTLQVDSLEEEKANSLALKMKLFYDSCNSLVHINIDGPKNLKRAITELGGWNVLRDFRTNDFDFNRVLRKVQGEYRVSPFFKISVVPDIVAPSRNIIKIVPSGLSLPHPSYYFEHEGPMAKAFQTFAKDVAQIMGTTSYQGERFATDMLNFEKRIAEITPNPSNLSDPVSSLEKLSVGELKGMSNTIFWGELLKSIFPKGTINDQTQVITPSNQYLVDISAIISSTDKGNLNNYLMWHLTQSYLPYLSKPYTEVVELFRRESIGTFTSPPRWEFCISETIRFFPHSSDFLLAENILEKRRQIKGSGMGTDPKLVLITEMFELIKQTVIERVNVATKYDESVRNFLLDKLRLMSIHIGNPLWNKTILQELYYSVSIQHNEFFLNVIALTELQGRLAERDLTIPHKESAIINAIAEQQFTVRFIPSLNKVFIPQFVLEMEQLNAPDSLSSLLYGTLGVEIAEAISSSFGPEKGLYFANGALMSSRDGKVQELRDIMNSRRSCLSSFFNNIRLDDEPYLERTSLDTTIHLAGIQIALEALRTHELSDSFQSLPGIDYSPDALFFLAYGQSQCSASSLLYHDMEHITFTSLSHDHRVRGVLRQMLAFTDAFSCSKSSEMYADFTCGHVI